MTNLDKSRFAQSLLTSEGQFNITARTGAGDASIPEYLRGEPHVTLTFGIGLPLPIHDLMIDESGVSGTLHFGPVGHFWCLVRWEAVQVINAPSGLGHLWLDGREPELRSTESKPDVHAQRVKAKLEDMAHVQPGWRQPGKASALDKINPTWWGTESARKASKAPQFGIKAPHLRVIQGGKGRTPPTGAA